MRRRDSNSHSLVYKTSTLIQLSYAAGNLVDWEGVKPSREVCRTSMLSVTSPARKILEARGGVEPRAFPPSSSEVRFRRPMPGTRAASGRGVRPTRLFELHDLRSHRSA